MDAVTEASTALAQQIVKNLPIIVIEEDVLLGIAPQDHVIEATRYVQARFASHRLSSRQVVETTIIQ